jgi:hypothetical protein
MRLAIAAIVAAGLVMAPAAAQETNEANMTAVNETENVADNVAAVPPSPTTAPPVAAAPVAEPQAAPSRDGGGGFPWGIIGLVGLAGLLGRVRS